MKKLIQMVDAYRLNILLRIERVFSNYVFILKNVWQAAPSYLAILVLIAIIGAFLPVIPLFLMKLVLDLLVSGSQSQQSMQNIIVILFGTGMINFLAQFTSFLRTYLSIIAVSIVEKHINLLILKKASTTDLHYVDSKDYYFKLDNARRALGRRWDNLVLAPVNLVAHLITLISLISILAGFSSWVVILLIVGVVPNIIVQVKIREEMNRFYTSQVDENRKITYIEQVLSDKRYAKEVRLFDLSNHLLTRIETLFESRHKNLNKIRSKELKLTSICSLLSFLTIAICQVFIAMMVLNKKISVGDWSLYAGTLQSINFNLNIAINIIANSYEEKLFSKVLNEFLSVNPKLNPNIGKHYTRTSPSVIEFRNVSFCYPDSEKYVLKNLSFKVHKGEHIALVGLNGAGKTTIVKLLTRLYEPTEGEILYDGVDIRKYKANDLYKLFGVVFQDFSQYAFSLRENIAISNIDNKDNMDAICKAAGIVGIDQIVCKLEDGYETFITKDYEKRGISNLSGGEWQKIALARGFFRDSPIVILDEPAASLDPLAEYEVYQKFIELCTNKTSITISHRLSSARLADRIFFLCNGDIIESGTHYELLKSNGEYAKLFNLQANQYHTNLAG